MCTVAGAAFAISALTSVASVAQSERQADTLEDSANLQAKENTRAAQAQIGERTRAHQRERGQLIAAFAESGIEKSSNSFAAALQASAFNESEDVAMLRQNARAGNAATQAQFANQYLATGAGVVNGALRIGGGLTDGYVASKRIDALQKKPRIQ